MPTISVSFESLQLCGYLTAKEAKLLTCAGSYKVFRSAADLLALQNQEGIVYSDHREAVTSKWSGHFDSGTSPNLSLLN